MILNGKYNQAEIFTDNIDSVCLDQIKNVLNCSAFKNEKIRIMPDCHAGAGCVIGYTQTLSNGKIVPNLVGVDINCGVTYVSIPEIDLKSIDKIIYSHVPSGMSMHKPGKLSSKLVSKVDNLLSDLYTPLTDKQLVRALNSVGTLGGGNHYIEVNKSVETNQWYLTIHSGSRNLGLLIAKYWQNVAINDIQNQKLNNIPLVIDELKKSGRFDEIESTIKLLKSKNADIPKELSYLQSDHMDQYLHDVAIVSKYADLNRATIAEIILGKLGVLSKKSVIKTTHHNYIDLDNMILRKGAISAQADEEVIIPLNMRDGSLICIGKGNPDWNYSAPHGAGRLMSRSEAKKNISLEEFRESMKGVYTTSVNELTIDESPMAYKSANEIELLISDTVEVREHLMPVYNFKAS